MAPPLHRNRLPAGVAVYGSRVGMTVGDLTALEGDVWIGGRVAVPGRALRDHMIAVAGVHRRIAIAVKYDGRNKLLLWRCAPAMDAAATGCSTLLHRGQRGRQVMGYRVGKSGMDADGGVEIRVSGAHDRSHGPAGR